MRSKKLDLKIRKPGTESTQNDRNLGISAQQLYFFPKVGVGN